MKRPRPDRYVSLTEEEVDSDRPKLMSPHLVREFARGLLATTTSDAKEKWFVKCGLKDTGGTVMRYTGMFPLWMFSSVCHFMMKLKTENSEFVDFSGGEHTAPSFDTIEFKRNEFLTTLVEGFFNTETTNGDGEKVSIIVSVNTGGYTAYVNIYCNKKDSESGKIVFDKLKKDVNMFPFLKNEKLLLSARQGITFLKYPEMHRDELILPTKVWDLLDRNLFFVVNNKKKMKDYGLDWRRGVLIWGVPGTGKTLFGRVICNEVEDVTVIWVTPRSIDDEGDIVKIFDMARKLAPTMLFMEDLDFFAASRDAYGPSFILGELLNQLDGLSSNEGIFVIGTTNKPGILDVAIGSRPSRFDVKIKFDLPSVENRESMYKLFLKKNDETVNYKTLSKYSDKLTGAHIKETVVRGVISILDDPSVKLEQAILRGISELKDEELIEKPPGGLVS